MLHVDYLNDQCIAHTGVVPPNKKMKLTSQVRSITFLFTPTYIYIEMEVFAKIINSFKSLAISVKAPS